MPETTLRPLRNRVIGRRLDEPDKPDGSMIWTPAGSRKERVYRCEVLAVGPKADGVEVGDKVLIGPYVDMDLEKKLVIFQDADIRVVFNG